MILKTSDGIASGAPEARSAALPGALLSVFAALLPLLYIRGLYHPAQLPREALIVLTATVGGLLLVRALRDGSMLWQKGLALPLSFVGLAAVSLNWSLDFGNSITELLELFACLMLALVSAQLVSHPTRLDTLFAALFASSSVAALIGLLQHFGWEPLGLHQSSPPASTFNNRNYAVVFLGPIVPLALFWALKLGRAQRALLWLSALTAGLSLSFVIASSNRGGALALLTAGLVAAWILGRQPRMRRVCLARARERMLPLLAAAAVVGLTVGMGDGNHRIEKLMEGELDNSATIRLHAYINAFPAILERPWLGTGYGGFRAGYSTHLGDVVPVNAVTEFIALSQLHSDPLEYFVELGIPGGLLACAIFLVVLRNIWRAGKRARAETRLRAAAVGFALLVIGIHSCVDFPLRLPASAALFWMLVGIGFSLHGARILPAIGVGARSVLATLALAYFAVATYVYAHFMSADALRVQSTIAASTGNCETGKVVADQVLNAFPFAFSSRMNYIKVYAICGDATERALASIWTIASDPSIPLAYLVRGDVRLRQGKLQGATADYERVVKLLPHRASGYVGLSAVATRLGELDSARTLLDQALRVQPDSEVARDRRAKLNQSPVRP